MGLALMFLINKSFRVLSVSYDMDLFHIMFIFFTCIKKTNQKKVQPITWSRKHDFPAFLETTVSLETRFAQTCQTPISVVSLVLGCVKRQESIIFK